MYKVNMHITPAKVRARVCDILAQYGKELIHLAHRSMREGENKWFILIAKDENSDSPCGYSIYNFNSEINSLCCIESALTYPKALITVGNFIMK